MAYTWDTDAHRYRDDSGRFVARSLVQDYVNRSLASTLNISETLSNLVYNGNLSVGDFYNSMREEIKREYIRQYLLGNGGRSQMTYSDWGKIGNMLKEQYKYLAGFAQDIAAGNLSEAQIRTMQTRARANMYFNSAREAYETAHKKQAEAWGAKEEKWNVSAMVENCPDCLGYSDMGWQPFDTFPEPGAGATVCLCILSPESMVLTYYGYKPMFDVKVGDLVWTHKLRWKPVTAIVIKQSKPGHQFDSLGRVDCTKDHLWYNKNGGWTCFEHSSELAVFSDETILPTKQAGDLHTYQMLWDKTNIIQAAAGCIANFRDVGAIGVLDRTFNIEEYLPERTAVFDLEVQGDHSFCIEGFFAHNTACHCWKVYRNEKGKIYYE